MERAKLIKIEKNGVVHSNRYLLKCAICGAEKWFGYKMFREIYPAKEGTRRGSSGNCVRCVNTKPNKGSFKKGQAAWNRGVWTKVGSYSVVHKWLVHSFGKAVKCENKDCLGLSDIYEWAKLRGKPYERNRENFVSLCKKCHMRYDLSGDEIRTT